MTYGLSALSGGAALPPKALLDTLVAELVRHRGAADPHDDITLVALKAT